MANIHDLFKSFNSIIRLNNDVRTSLIISRNALKVKIRRYFENNKPNEIQPKFAGQGSFSMDTVINPIIRYDDDGNIIKYYDLDYGIYFIGSSKDDKKSIQSYHSWVLSAVSGHTNSQTDKNTCVRVNYADGHNIDFPIYFKVSQCKPELAHKGKGWIESDPKEMYDWFNTKAKSNAQLRRIVRYLKAWKDNREYCNQSVNMPSGLVLTVLASNNYAKNDRDDIALRDTLIGIQSQLKLNFECFCPATPNDEILSSRYTQKDYFLRILNSFVEDAKKAILDINYLSASQIWEKHLGVRFPEGNDEEDEEQKRFNKLSNLSSTAVIINAGNAYTDRKGAITEDPSNIKNQSHRFYGN